jgi:hypothetical protein
MEQITEARRLATLAAQDQLALYFVSQPGLLPDLSDLYLRIANKCGALKSVAPAYFLKLSLRDQARLFDASCDLLISLSVFLLIGLVPAIS